MPDQQGAQRESDFEAMLLQELYRPACAPLYWALCRLYGTTFALDLAKTCVASDGDVPLSQSFGYWARFHIQPYNPEPEMGMPPPVYLPSLPPPECHDPYFPGHEGPVERPVCRFCRTDAMCSPECAPELAYSFYWTGGGKPSAMPERRTTVTESHATNPRHSATEPVVDSKPQAVTATASEPPKPSPTEAQDVADRPYSTQDPPIPAAPSWSSVVRRATGSGPVLLRRPKRFDDCKLFAPTNTQTAVQLAVTEEHLVALIQAAPKPVLVCEPSQAAVVGVQLVLGSPLPTGVQVTTVARAAVKTAIQGASRFKAVLVHVSPQLVESGLVQRLVSSALADDSHTPALVAYCRSAVAPVGVFGVRSSSGASLWSGQDSGQEIKAPDRPQRERRAVPLAVNGHVADLQQPEAASVVAEAIAELVISGSSALVVLSTPATPKDVVALRKAFRRSGRLVSRVDVVTVRVHRPVPQAVLSAVRTGTGRQCDYQKVLVVPVGVDAHWGTLPLLLPVARSVSVVDTATGARFDPTANDLSSPVLAGAEEAAARSSLVGANGTLMVCQGKATPQSQPQPSKCTPSALDYMHGMGAPCGLLVEALRAARDHAVDASSPALPLLKAWHLAKESSAFDPDELFASKDKTTSWADDDPFARPGARPTGALLDWCVVAAEMVDDRAALLVLIGIRFCVLAAGKKDNQFDQRFNAWCRITAVFNELTTLDPRSDLAPSAAAARAKALNLPKGADDLRVGSSIALRIQGSDSVKPGPVESGAISKQTVDWCQSCGLHGQASQQLTEGASQTEGSLRMAMQALDSIGSRIFTAGVGEYPIDTLVPDWTEIGQGGSADVEPAVRAALSNIGPRFVRDPKRRGEWTCSCALCACPGAVPVRACLGGPAPQPPPATIVPIQISKQRGGSGLVVHSFMTASA